MAHYKQLVVKYTLSFFFTFGLLLLTTFSRAQLTDVLTQHNDYNRSGWDSTETILNTSNVTPTNFGLLYKRNVNDQIYAQPLVVTGVMIGGVPKNIVYVATVSNRLYAFDADDGTIDPYWTDDFTPSGETIPNAIDIHANLCGFTYTDFQGNFNLGQIGSFGIVGTPVIDKSTNTIYLVSRYRDMVVDNTPLNTTDHSDDPQWSSAGFYEVVHALDLSTGAEKFNGPVVIDPVTTAVPGVGPSHDASNMVHWDPRRNNQRGGLLISNGVVYIPFGGHCDMNDYHGWILGYQTNDLTKQVIRYATTPNDGRGGIWMSGAGPALDASGNLFFTTGNATDSSLASSPSNVGLSVIKAAPDFTNHTLQNVAWLKPTSYTAYNVSDLDFGTGIVLVPGSNMLVTAHKTGRLMVTKKNAIGGEFNETSSNFLGAYDLGAGNSAQSHSGISYFGGTNRQYIYQFSEFTHVQAFPVNRGASTLGSPIINTSVPGNTGLEGGYSSVSSNGGDPSTAILWVTHLTGPGGGTMHALKADDITQELWNSDGNALDALGRYSKMCPVTIANGKVYAPTFSGTLNVYGLLAGNSRCINNVALNKPTKGSPNTDNANVPASNANDGNPLTRWGVFGGLPTYLIVDLQSRFDICKIDIHWNNIMDYATFFNIDISDDTTAGWTTVNTITNNIFPSGGPFQNTYNEHCTGRFVRINVQPGSQFFTSIAEILIFGSPANNCIAPSVSGMSVTNITTNSATLNWMPVPGVTDYIVKYKGPTVDSYITRYVHDGSGSGNPLSIDIGALTCGFSYDFDIQSDCGGGHISETNKIPFKALPCSTTCLPLTRFYNGDLGNIPIAGSSCYVAPEFNVAGSGSGLGGNGDQFQFFYADLNNDEDFVMRISSQDPTPASNMAGIMMRDSVTDIARFIFIGKTGDNNLLMIYRQTVGGTAVIATTPNALNANYFRINKSGNVYSAFFGISSTGPWNQILSAPQSVNLGFGSQTIKIGMAVASLSTMTDSKASFDNLDESSTPLPIRLLNFTANNENDEYVSLKWQTGMEENNDHFEIERSTDGTHFEKIITVKAVGNSSTIQSYSATDGKPARGLNFYRLKQVDIDNRYTYSPVRTVKFGSGIAPLIYPNPVTDIFTAVPGTDPIREIVIYNVQGKAVQFEMGASMNSEMKVNISRLASGVYYLKIKTDSKIFQYKVVKE